MRDSNTPPSGRPVVSVLLISVFVLFFGLRRLDFQLGAYHNVVTAVAVTKIPNEIIDCLFHG